MKTLAPTSNLFFPPRRLLVAVLLLGHSMVAIAQAQVLRYTFNDAAGTSVANSGTAGSSGNLTMYNSTGTATDYLSAYSSGGVTGIDGTQTLNLTSATQMGGTSGSPGAGPYAASSTAGSVLSNAVSFTMAGWYNATATVGSSARIFQVNGASQIILDFTGSNILSLQVGANTTNSNGSGGVASGTINYNTTNTWTFFATTYSYNSSSNLVTVTFYSGTTLSNLASYTLTYTPSSGTLGTETGLSVGSNVTSGSNVRPFEGSFDNLSIYASSTDSSGALDATAVTNLFLSTVPEPSAMSFLIIALLGLGLRRLERKPSTIA